MHGAPFTLGEDSPEGPAHQRLMGTIRYRE